MKLRIPKKMIERLAVDLERAGSREIGGVLFGEQLAEGDFRIIEATRQRFFGGTATTFNRRGRGARKEILALHEKASSDPERFNYLGEWHSHPNAPAQPSVQDEFTMHELLTDQGGAVNFLVLMIMKLDDRQRLHLGAVTYLASGHKLQCEIEIEDEIAATSGVGENDKETSR